MGAGEAMSRFGLGWRGMLRHLVVGDGVPRKQDHQKLEQMLHPLEDVHEKLEQMLHPLEDVHQKLEHVLPWDPVAPVARPLVL
jgi:hypothetical protein